MEKTKNQCVLIVDDVEMNRAMLVDVLQEDYTIFEASNGQEALDLIAKQRGDLSIVLLDKMMPVLDGFGVLKAMDNDRHDIERIPVIMVTAADDEDTVAKAYELGVADFLSKGDSETVIKRRIKNTLALFNKQQILAALVKEKIGEQQKNMSMMIGTLSSIVETRNHESASHTLHIKTITHILLNQLMKKKEHNPEAYADIPALSKKDIDLICLASSLHDIGKMRIPEEVLNKPGRFTDEEYAIMKQHTVYGYEMLVQQESYQDELFMKYTREIARWHHERFDGRGYPDRKKGTEIPIWAHVVAVADVYDALTAERVYKKAFSHETAIKMILNGECGAFDQRLLDCMLECQEEMHSQLDNDDKIQSDSLDEIAREALDEHPIGLSQRALDMYHLEAMKNDYYTEMSDGVHFDYSYETGELLLRKNTRLHCAGKVVKYPRQNRDVINFAGQDVLDKFVALAKETTPENSCFANIVEGEVGGLAKRYRIEAKVLFEEDKHIGVIGKITPLEETE